MQYSEKSLQQLLFSEVEKLTTLTEGYITKSVSISEMERGYLKQLISLGLSLLKFVIKSKVERGLQERPIKQGKERIKNSGKRMRSYLSLFGLIEFSRPSYHSDTRGMIYMVDEELSMPRDLWSYNLQELTASNASETNFRESVKLLNALLNLRLSSAGSERNIDRLGGQVDAYYADQSIEQVSQTACFCASFDGKGVPKVKPRNKDSSKRFARLKKGEKRGIKQMATVCVVSSFEPKKRTPCSIVDGLMGWYEQKQEAGSNDNKWHEFIHRRSFLADQDKAIDYGLRRIKKRIKSSHNKFVVPIDAGIGLEDRVYKYVKIHQLEHNFDGIILDIIHVSEYVWDCVNAIFGEKSELRSKWVSRVLVDLLESKTQKVIADLQNIVDKTHMTKNRKEKVSKAITYFTNHAHKMDYKQYLEKGYPVSSAIVESTCKHLVKDRMEKSGMRWSDKGAQNMMDVRAVKLNGDLENFIHFISKNDRKSNLKHAA